MKYDSGIDQLKKIYTKNQGKLALNDKLIT